MRALLLPEGLTGVAAPIVLLYAKDFPTGSHKVGATYSVLMERQLAGDVSPGESTLVWPSTGNYGIGGAWVGCRMQFDSVVILPEEMSLERFEIVRRYGARLELTPGCESSVKEIYDKCHELRRSDPARIRVMNQFEELALYPIEPGVKGTYRIDGGALAVSYDSLSVYRTLLLQVEKHDGDEGPVYSLLPPQAVLRDGRVIITAVDYAAARTLIHSTSGESGEPRVLVGNCPWP